MATIITVHGTFAKPTVADPDGGREPDNQWWETPSTFEKEIRELVEAQDGRLDIRPFVWPGDNSEVERRDAGRRLASLMRELELKNEPYCVVGHSHGGSIVSSALLDNAARKRPLQNLKRWITVGTPFVSLKREFWLLTRLSLVRKVVFVASLMLLLMLIIYLIASMTGSGQIVFGRIFPRILVLTIVLSSLPAVFIFLLFKFLDSRALLTYHRRITRRARENFGSRWLAFSHPDDEAIQGLAMLPDAKLTFFDKSFAVPTITLISVVALPLLYLLMLYTPSINIAFAEWLRDEVYAANVSSDAENDLRALRDELRSARKAQGETQDSQGAVQPEQTRHAAWQNYRAKREALQGKYPNLDAIERGIRFKERFFERDGAPCEGGTLCGQGKDIAVNSALPIHVITDEATWELGVADRGSVGATARFLWAVGFSLVLVPLTFGLLALGLMILIRYLAAGISYVTSLFLNSITNREVKRAGFGNDTEGEIATGAIDRPTWLEKSPPRLPIALADLVTNYSNAAASQSIAKFRHAIGQVRFAVPPHTADTAISTYFTWKELVHASYFDVPEFRKLVAQALSRADGFAPSERFKADPDFERTAQWLAAVEDAPGTTDVPSDREPGPKDAKAVAAVVTSVVKAEP